MRRARVCSCTVMLLESHVVVCIDIRHVDGPVATVTHGQQLLEAEEQTDLDNLCASTDEDQLYKDLAGQ